MLPKLPWQYSTTALSGYVLNSHPFSLLQLLLVKYKLEYVFCAGTHTTLDLGLNIVLFFMRSNMKYAINAATDTPINIDATTAVALIYLQYHIIDSYC